MAKLTKKSSKTEATLKAQVATLHDYIKGGLSQKQGAELFGKISDLWENSSSDVRNELEELEEHISSEMGGIAKQSRELRRQIQDIKFTAEKLLEGGDKLAVERCLDSLEQQLQSPESLDLKPEDLAKIKEELAAKTPEKMILYKTYKDFLVSLTSSATKPEFQRQFLLTYRAILKEKCFNQAGATKETPRSVKLFTLLNEHFVDAGTTLEEKQHILSLAKQWLSDKALYGADRENPAVRGQVQQLIASAKHSFNDEAHELEQAMEPTAARADNTENQSNEGLKDVADVFVELEHIDQKSPEYQQHVEKFSQDLQAFSAQQFHSVSPQDLLLSVVDKTNDAYASYVANSNRLSQFFAYQLLNAETPEKRTLLQKFFVDVMDRLLDPPRVDGESPMDIYSANAINGALELDSTRRLSWGDDAVKSHQQEISGQLADWRQKGLPSDIADRPHIPFFGSSIMTNVVQLDAVPSITSEQQVNDSKVVNLGKVLEQVNESQKHVEQNRQCSFVNLAGAVESEKIREENLSDQLKMWQNQSENEKDNSLLLTENERTSATPEEKNKLFTKRKRLMKNKTPEQIAKTMIEDEQFAISLRKQPK